MIDQIATVFHWSIWICAPFAWLCVFITWRRARHAQELEKLLTVLVINAYLHRHLPIWVAWSRMTGLEFHINLDDVREKQP